METFALKKSVISRFFPPLLLAVKPICLLGNYEFKNKKNQKKKTKKKNDIGTQEKQAQKKKNNMGQISGKTTAVGKTKQKKKTTGK